VAVKNSSAAGMPKLSIMVFFLVVLVHKGSLDGSY
jgi:hypothetical protein